MPLDEETMAMIPEEARSSPTWDKFKDRGEVFKSYVELEKRAGNSISIPDEKATPEDLQKWKGEHLSKLQSRGIVESAPESPDKYEWKFENVPPDEIANDKVLAKFAPIAHELGLSNRQANALVEKFGKDILPDMMPAPEFADTQSVVQKAFGAQTTETLNNYKKAMAAIQQSDPELAEIIKDGMPRTADGKFIHLMDHPAMIRFVNKAFQMQQDFAGNAGSGIGESAQAIEDEIHEIRYNKTNSKHQLLLNGDEGVQTYLDGLYQKLHKIKGDG